MNGITINSIKRLILVIISLLLFVVFVPSFTWCMDKIKGNACYTYGDNESLVQAEQTAKTLAIRSAIESYSVYVESTTKIVDLRLSSDLIKAISVGQVKKVKVLNRSQTGRKICFTVEGFVEPAQIKKTVRDYLSSKKESSDVRLKENDWIRINNTVDIELTPEEFYKSKSDSPMVIYEKESRKKENKRENFRRIYTEIQFLKPCNAITLTDKLKECYSYKPSAIPVECKQYEDVGMISYGLGLILSSNKDEDTRHKQYAEYQEKMEKAYPYFLEYYNDYCLFPKFKCDYRIKVFATFYNSYGFEIETDGKIPFARIENEKLKTEMLPGETTFVTFLIPDEAESWYVWVPK